MFCEDFGSRRDGSLGEAGRCRLGATDFATVAARAALNARRSERSGGKRHGFRLTAAGPRWTAVDRGLSSRVFTWPRALAAERKSRSCERELDHGCRRKRHLGSIYGHTLWPRMTAAKTSQNLSKPTWPRDVTWNPKFWYWSNVCFVPAACWLAHLRHLAFPVYPWIHNFAAHVAIIYTSPSKNHSKP